jgi:hypothetical protein
VAGYSGRFIARVLAVCVLAEVAEMNSCQSQNFRRVTLNPSRFTQVIHARMWMSPTRMCCRRPIRRILNRKSDAVFQPAVGLLRNSQKARRNQAARNANPPNGVTAPNAFTPVSASA